MKMMNIDFQKIFDQLEIDLTGNQRKLLVNSSLKVYYGITTERYYRISFMSTILPPKIDSTNNLFVSQGQESDEVYWTCFDLTNTLAKKVFYSFCQDLILAITDKYEEREALYELKNRYYSWKSLFKNKKKMSLQSNQGLFGELVFLKNIMFEKFSIQEAIESWVGPDGANKDFSINDEWFEIKTIGSTSNFVKISSISQLSAKNKGNLVVVKVEKMSEQYDDGQSCVIQLFKDIMIKVNDNELKEKFVEKLLRYGFDVEDNNNQERYKIISITTYVVDQKFPRLLETDIKHQEISNVSYDLVLSTLDKFRKE